MSKQSLAVRVNRDQVIASLDLHDLSIYVLIVHQITGEVLFDNNVLGGYPSVLKVLNRFPEYKKRMIILFEAGCHGFYPFRVFTNAGYQVKMIAPHSIPQKNRQKTDRVDCFENIKDYVAGNFRFVVVPTKEIIDVRELLRARMAMANDVAKKKQRINALLKRHGCFYTETKSKWTRKHFVWMKNVELEYFGRYLLTRELMNLERMEKELTELETEVITFFDRYPEYKDVFEMLQCFNGIGPICAMLIIFEGGDQNRFSHPRKLMSYTGLVPGLYSSGGSNPHLAITKTGNAYLRYAYVCASKSYANYKNLYTKKQLLKYPEPMRELLERTQQRLFSRMQRLKSKGKHVNVARCAVARELCSFTWEFYVKILPQIQKLKKAA